ncbi:MAG: hypothetical protein O7D91_13475 [Planctomycetota bacterium]|nr:hypothetical protein [Planctomycetota bacterium]
MTLYEYAKAAVWIAGLVTGACALTHKVVKDDFSKRFGKALAGYDLTVAVRRWPSHFVELFDSVFGSKHWSWFCIRRSCYCSLGGLVAVAITYFVLASVSFSEFFRDWRGVEPKPYDYLTILLVPTFNVLPDFFSLLETRWLISRLGQNPSLTKLAGALLLDLILTAAIFFAFTAPMVFAAMWWVHFDGTGEHTTMKVFSEVFESWCEYFITPRGEYIPNFTSFTFYTTFLTSVWVWMLGGSVLAAKLLSSLGGPLWRWLSGSFLDFETKPFLSLGWIAGASVLTGGLVCLPVLWMTGTIQ